VGCGGYGGLMTRVCLGDARVPGEGYFRPFEFFWGA